MEVWKEYKNGNEINGINVITIPEDANEANATIDQSAEDIIALPKDTRVLTRDILLGRMLSKPKQIGWQAMHRQYLQDMTHLHMDRKKLSSVSVNAPGTNKPILGECCPSLQVLFLQDNYLTNLGKAFQGLKNLTQINLYGNFISQMDCFEDCVNLRKLYMEHNRISHLKGLQNCQRLEELYLGNQKIRKHQEFIFDEYSLAAISNTLEVLDLPAVNLVICKPLYFLERLTTLNLNDNLIDDFDEQVSPMLMTL